MLLSFRVQVVEGQFPALISSIQQVDLCTRCSFFHFKDGFFTFRIFQTDAVVHPHRQVRLMYYEVRLLAAQIMVIVRCRF